ncbi:acyl carrier protein [Empedobacter falsenii]|jgi:acyl carrier protein|uniref:Acyl carrier protein n=1 Tax=Empedobacter falsenii TaxID=343874 RepID=A0A376G4G3_9FLAO|nr:MULTISPECIES: phosphopantetheine-binding protein [Empedobacter]HCC94861.1 acyl carrier protein [Flavobacteriaceae bacterium]MDH1881710.1 phosphopantetheine-binding protein [Empedobacter sp. GD03797]MDH2205992.1 phosphopantetheine-binding protein [Empedobacter sp. GD03644]MDM1041432.1 acyl carrier protein [Empedobacter brevis]MDM1063357.1 acyl carrier protein [Empedobacter falsenii]
MVKSQIAEKLNAILIDEFEVDPSVISEEKNIKESLDLDSLDYVDLVVIIESNFGVKLIKEDFQNMITFEDFYAIVEQKLENK